MKKILLAIDDLGSGGAQNQITLLAKGLTDYGYYVLVFTYYSDNFFKERLDDANIEVITVKKKDKIGFGVIWGLIKIIRSKKIDTIISFLDTPNFYAALAKQFSFTNVKLIISYRSKTRIDRLSFINKRLKYYSNDIANVIVANSHHERTTWLELQPKNLRKWHTIYNCVDQLKFNFKGINNRGNHFIVVASVSPEKNGLILIDALNWFKRNNINIKVKWIGKKELTLPEKRIYYEKMAEQIQFYGLEEYWEWVGPDYNIQNWYSTNRALILPSQTEGLPNVVCEALSCGLPCIVSNVLDHPNLIKSSYNGFLFNINDVSDLIKCMQNMLNLKEEEYIQMCRNAVESADTLFAYQKFINEYIALV